MAKNIIGIDISDFSIEAVALEKHKKSFKIESYARFRLSPEIVEDGRILNKEKLKEAILKMFKNAKPIPFDVSRKVFLSVPESRTFSKVLSLPKSIKNKEIKHIAIDKAEEFIPESIDLLTSIVKTLDDADKYKQVFYSAAETEVLNNFVDIFTDLNIDVVGITTEANSSFAGIKKDKHFKNILLLDLGARTTIASIFTKAGLYSNININIGGDNITRAIAKKLNISYKKAEDKKIKIGLTADKTGEIMLITQGQLQPLVDELKVFIKYWQRSTGQSIEQVVLIGGLSQMKDADKYFGDDLELPTIIGRAFIDTKSMPKGLNFSKYINALGLARLAHQGTDINFYDKLSKEKIIKNKDIKSGQSKEKKIVIRFKQVFTKNNFYNLHKNKYTWIALVFIFLLSGAFFFKSKISVLNKKVLPTWEEKIFVALENPDEVANFIQGEDYSFLYHKIYDISTDIDLPEDYVESFESNIIRLERQANKRILAEIKDSYTPENYYVIPKILFYESIDIIPSEDDYVVGDDLEANVKYKFMMFSEQVLKDWIIAKRADEDNIIDHLDYDTMNYSTDENGNSFNILVTINK